MIFVPRRLPTIVLGLIGATLAISIAAALDGRNGGNLYQWLALEPAEVWRGQVWRLVTWTWIERSPWALVFGCVTLYWFGGDLVAAWGPRRFTRFVAAIVMIAGAGTAAVGLVVDDAWHYAHLGGWALGDALVVAWALQFPWRRIYVYGPLVVGGALLAYGTVAITVLFAVFYGSTLFLPELFAGGAALLHMSGSLPRWRSAFERRYRRRHLRVVRA